MSKKSAVEKNAETKLSGTFVDPARCGTGDDNRHVLSPNSDKRLLQNCIKCGAHPDISMKGYCKVIWNRDDFMCAYLLASGDFFTPALDKALLSRLHRVLFENLPVVIVENSDPK